LDWLKKHLSYNQNQQFFERSCFAAAHGKAFKQPVAVWQRQRQRQQCLWCRSSGSLGIRWQFFAE
jgi:hypothetical protein